MARPADGDPEAGDGWLPTGRGTGDEVIHYSLQRNQKEQTKDQEHATQTSNAFEASAGSHGWPRVRGCRRTMRRKMRRRPDYLWLAVHASGEQLQIACAVGGSEAARAIHEHRINDAPSDISCHPSTTFQRFPSSDFCCWPCPADDQRCRLHQSVVSALRVL